MTVIKPVEESTIHPCSNACCWRHDAWQLYCMVLTVFQVHHPLKWNVGWPQSRQECYPSLPTVETVVAILPNRETLQRYAALSAMERVMMFHPIHQSWKGNLSLSSQQKWLALPSMHEAQTYSLLQPQWWETLSIPPRCDVWWPLPRQECHSPSRATHSLTGNIHTGHKVRGETFG